MTNAFRTMQSACLADWGPAIETAARRIAAVLVAVYVAGYLAGSLVHRLNDRLAAFYVALTVTGFQKPARRVEQPPAPIAPPQPAKRVAEAPGPVSAAACGQTVAQLRQMARAKGIKTAGGRKVAQATKAALLAVLA
jgi:hypothetical protein